MNNPGDSLTICHQNIQSLRNKIDEVEVECELNKIDILCLSEHWMTCDQIISIKIEGYTLVNYFCRSNFKNGGVAIFCRNELIDNVKEI